MVCSSQRTGSICCLPFKAWQTRVCHIGAGAHPTACVSSKRLANYPMGRASPSMDARPCTSVCTLMANMHMHARPLVGPPGSQGVGTRATQAHTGVHYAKAHFRVLIKHRNSSRSHHKQNGEQKQHQSTALRSASEHARRSMLQAVTHTAHTNTNTEVCNLPASCNWEKSR